MDLPSPLEQQSRTDSPFLAEPPWNGTSAPGMPICGEEYWDLLAGGGGEDVAVVAPGESPPKPNPKRGILYYDRLERDKFASYGSYS